ncbi:glycerophosphodiester phosphodiesterase family protein [Yunchengibacter salinarum]|uniref:glycerophosphodiester phosphodiesterase family protein n=1 Tax=Yunchengibacter salinarum TaxID=3133399 RepID=UPI0035B5B205
MGRRHVRKGAPPRWLTSRPIAHRGLHGDTGLVENTLPAIREAVNQGLGIEIDVRMTRDDMIVAFHDDMLTRLAGRPDRIAALVWSDLADIPLHQNGGTASVPLLRDVVDAIGEAVPLFIEIKADDVADRRRLCAGVVRALEGYKGPVAVMSFDPRLVAWFRDFAPDLARGLIVGRDWLLVIRRRLAASLWLHRLRADFLACDIRLLPNSLATSWRRRRRPVLTWTVRSAQDVEVASEHADQVIFERPAPVKATDTPA